MASHCPYCDSTDIVGPLVSPRGVTYYHCNECNRNFITPVVDPTAASDTVATSPAPDAGEDA